MMDRPCWSLAVNGLLLKTLQVKISYTFWNLIRSYNNEVNFPCLTPAPKRSPARSVMIWCTVHQLISSRAIVWLDKPSTKLLCFRFYILLCLVSDFDIVDVFINLELQKTICKMGSRLGQVTQKADWHVLNFYNFLTPFGNWFHFPSWRVMSSPQTLLTFIKIQVPL